MEQQIEFTEFVARSALTIVPSTISAELMSVPRVALICVPGVMVIPVPAVQVVSTSAEQTKAVPFHCNFVVPAQVGELIVTLPDVSCIPLPTLTANVYGLIVVPEPLLTKPELAPVTLVTSLPMMPSTSDGNAMD